MTLKGLAGRLAAVHPLTWLALGGLASFGGPAILRLGLYHDDWTLLDHMASAPPGLFSAAEALVAGERKALLRPLIIPIFAGLYSVFGLGGWQAVNLAAGVWTAWSLFRLARVYGASEAASLGAALLWLGYPNKDSTAFANFGVINALSLGFLAEGLVANVSYAADGSRARLGWSLCCLGVSVASYDQSLLMFPLWGLAPRGPGRSRARSSLFAAGALTLVYAAYKFGLGPRLVPEPRPMQLSAERFPALLGAALSSQFGLEMLAGAAHGLADALRYHVWLVLAALALPWLAIAGRRAEPGASGRQALACGGAMLALSYAVLLPSLYVPNPITLFNRLNNLGAFAVCLAASAAAGSVKLGPRGLAILAGLSLAAHSGFALYWVVSAQMQERVRALVAANLASWPAEKLLILRPNAHLVGRRAPVFLESWDTSSAMHLWTGDRRRRADVVKPGMIAEPDGLRTRDGLVPYPELVVLDAWSGRFSPGSRAAIEPLLR